MFTVSTTSGNHMQCTDAPNVCPNCQNTITPLEIIGSRSKAQSEVVFKCPNVECRQLFIAYYEAWGDGTYKFGNRTNFGRPSVTKFTENIVAVSKFFTIIYNQAKVAEEMGLEEICGVGYRKALEFLIKDYCIFRHPIHEETIKKQTIAKCIGDFVDDARIKSVANRAFWLGNDETHYIRKWEGKNLADLKLLISLTVHWIEMETLTQAYNDSMPKS